MELVAPEELNDPGRHTHPHTDGKSSTRAAVDAHMLAELNVHGYNPFLDSLTLLMLWIRRQLSECLPWRDYRYLKNKV